MLLIAGCAAGAGVTGTLMWARGASAPAYEPVASPEAPAQAEVAQDAQAEPPPMLTQGMSAAQGALTLGNWYFDHRRWNEAVSQYKNALAGGLDNADVRTDLGSALRFAGEPKEALKQYQIAQGQDPSHENSLFNQGALLATALGDKARGIAAWRAYLKKFPQGQSAQAARELLQKTEAELKKAPSKK